MNKLVSVLFVAMILLFAKSEQCIAQLKGIDDFITAAEHDKSGETIYEKWIKSEDSYLMFFKQNPVGYKHAISKIQGIVKINGFDFNNPTRDDCLIPSFADNIYDFENMDLGIRTGSGEVIKVWQTPKLLIGFVCNEGQYTILAEETIDE